jgi:hypothetical protein
MSISLLNLVFVYTHRKKKRLIEIHDLVISLDEYRNLLTWFIQIKELRGKKVDLDRKHE